MGEVMNFFLKCFCALLVFSCLFKSSIIISKQFRGYHLEDSFDVGMIGSKEAKGSYENFLRKTPHKPLLNTLRTIYEDYVNTIETLFSPEPKIPKIIHQIWIGPYPFPKEARGWQKTWQELHPDWEYKLWTNEDLEKLSFENKKFFDKAKNWGERADILRYEIIYRFGGLYVDIDEKCFKSFDLLHHSCNFYAGVHTLPLLTSHKNKLRVANGIFAAAPGHPIMGYAIEEIKRNRHHRKIYDRTGPDYLTRMIAKWLNTKEQDDSLDVVFPANYFYPLGQRSGGLYKIKPGGKIHLKPETIAAHYYACYWQNPPKS